MLFRACFLLTPRDKDYQTVSVCVDYDDATDTVADVYNRALATFGELTEQRSGYEKEFADFATYGIDALPVMGLPIQP